MNKADPLTMINVVLTSLSAVMEGQIPFLKAFVEEQAKQQNNVDIVLHDSATFAGPVICHKYNIPCVELNVIMNSNTAFMGMWRPAIGMELSPFHPPFLDRLGLAFGGFVSRLFSAYVFSNILQTGDTLINDGQETGLGSQHWHKSVEGWPRANAVLVTVPPGLDQSQVVPPSTVFVGPMRDMERYPPIVDNSPIQKFLDQAASDGVPVIFMAAGVTADITDEFVQQRLEVIEQVTSNARVVWANRRGLLDREGEQVDPSKLLVSTWLPQEAVLRHPAVKVFVTHGGSTSMMEGVAAGVPLICNPYAFEQVNNCILLESRKMGRYVPKDAPLSDLAKGILDVLANQEAYASQDVSIIWNRIVGFGSGGNAYGARKAVRVVETVAANGNEYLIPEICHWPLYQQYHLDVAAFSVALVAFTIWFWRTLFRLVWNKCFGKPSKPGQVHVKQA